MHVLYRGFTAVCGFQSAMTVTVNSMSLIYLLVPTTNTHQKIMKWQIGAEFECRQLRYI